VDSGKASQNICLFCGRVNRVVGREGDGGWSCTRSICKGKLGWWVI